MKTLVERLLEMAENMVVIDTETVALLEEAATALTSPETGGVLADSVAEVMDECGGAWRPCTGCYETSDGYNINGHPYSKTFKCIVGSGCHECGGIGAIWDNADYSTIGPAEYADERKETGGGSEAMREAAAYVIWSNEHGAWWRPKSSGYTRILGEAGRYDKAEAEAICRDGGRARAWSTGLGPYEEMLVAPPAAPAPEGA